ncbi:hypothetical protein IHE44_0012823 [Lamprotornis superbus]|uniref:CTLH domain-containing protein n=1 Tax=Lamprotornis superbus TaxID=245042 RepID=A0A835NN08_9PASS|nr:hypothetical protein IHE44_0012823 [Lamprotornis superbus]
MLTSEWCLNQGTKDQDGDLSGTISLVMTQCCKRIKDTVQKLASDHKDIHSSVSRVGKAIDKNFDSDISSVGIDGCWQADSQRILNEVMVEHFFRQGMLDVAEELCQESGLSIDQSQKEPFVELNRILEALKVRVLRPALEWAVSNREMLMAQNSSLEFKLHRLYFISLLMGGTANQREALQYAKNFQPFALNHQKDIQVLMGSLVYLRQGIENSPFSAGCVALPALINIKAVIEQRQCTGVWNQKDELPIEVDLGWLLLKFKVDVTYHSEPTCQVKGSSFCPAPNLIVFSSGVALAAASVTTGTGVFISPVTRIPEYPQTLYLRHLLGSFLGSRAATGTQHLLEYIYSVKSEYFRLWDFNL